MFYEKSVMEMAIDMAFVTEAFGKGMKELLSENSKNGKAHIKEARKLKKQGDKSGAKKEYQKALDYMNKVKQSASKIEDETVFDWIIYLFIKPWWYLIYQGIEADFDFNGLTRQSTLKQIDRYITQIKSEMNSL